MKTPIEVLLAVADGGGKLGIVGDRLRTLLPADCDPALKEAIRRHKLALLKLLRLSFRVVRSDSLNITIFWTPDQAVKESLAAAGADWGRIYTASEIERLVLHRVTAEELPLIHAARNCFGGRIIRE